MFENLIIGYQQFCCGPRAHGLEGRFQNVVVGLLKWLFSSSCDNNKRDLFFQNISCNLYIFNRGYNSDASESQYLYNNCKDDSTLCPHEWSPSY